MPEQFTQGPSILQSDIVNNLTTDSSTKPLSAAQGKVLKDATDTINSDLTKSIKSVCPIAEGNTHSAFVAGMIIYIRNHPTLTEGSYTVTQYVAKDATLSDSNVTYNYYGGLDVLNSIIANCAKTTSANLSTSGTEMSLPGGCGIVVFRIPRTVAIAWGYVLLYVKQNANVNVKWLSDTPADITVTSGVDKITVTHSLTNGLYANAIMISN